ncbi:MAG: cellulase family glycosylhydrolase [bacterium]
MKNYRKVTLLIFFQITAAMLFISCSHTGMFGKAPAKVRLERIGLSKDNAKFIRVDSGAPFVIWGVNYDHDGAGRLLEDYWCKEWPTIVEDFKEIKELGANVVRIHLQTAKFITTARKPDEEALKQLARLVALAEKTGLYLDITGLACYHKKDVPEWYAKMSESERWEIQSIFWSAVAKTCAQSPAVFCYDLMNEPVMAGAKGETDWLAGEFAGSCFVQRITLDLAGRTREQVAKAWVDKLVAAIREQDKHHLITVGVIPWAMVWPNAKPFFNSKEVGENLDFVSVHFYPEKDKVDKALTALAVYDVGKPLVIEEMFPLSCSAKELEDFIDGSRTIAEGWISFYWGKTISEYAEDRTIAGAITKEWLEHFRTKAPSILGTKHEKDPKKR